MGMALILSFFPGFAKDKDPVQEQADAQAEQKFQEINKNHGLSRDALKARYGRKTDVAKGDEKEDLQWELEKELETLEKEVMAQEKEALKKASIKKIMALFAGVPRVGAIMGDYFTGKEKREGTYKRQEKLIEKKEDLEQLKKDYDKDLEKLKEDLIDKLVKAKHDKDLVDQYAGDAEAQAKAGEYLKARDALEKQCAEDLAELEDPTMFGPGEKVELSGLRKKRCDQKRRKLWKDFQDWLKQHKDKMGLSPAPGTGFGGYMEGYLAFAGNSSSGMNPQVRTCLTNNVLNLDGMDASVGGGMKLGLWFTYRGNPLPAWLQYFGFYTDFSYQRLNFSRQSITNTATGYAADFSSEGTAATWTFMFAGRYGFLPDSEVPFGRLQPYVAVGPGILFTSQEPTLLVRPNAGAAFEGIKPGSNSAAVFCLAVDAGVRYMLLKNVSLDVFFKYRYAEPRFSYTYQDAHLPGQNLNLRLSPTFNLFSGHVGVAYHF